MLHSAGRFSLLTTLFPANNKIIIFFIIIFAIFLILKSDMNQRSSHNWKTKSGGWDSLNTAFIDFDLDFPVVGSFSKDYSLDLVMCNNYKSLTNQSLVSTFVDDYILERFWNNPQKYINYFQKVKHIMSPDFSLLIGMPAPMQAWNVYRNRLIGYVWQSAGIDVIPTISWSNEGSFDYCFEGVAIGSTVAISNTGCRNDIDKEVFDAGFNEMLKRLSPQKILFQCNRKYKTRYEGDGIIFIDSFWDNKRKQLKKQ